MVFELTQETVRPGRLPVLLGSLQVAVRWRDGEYGTLAGSWTTEIGTLNRCITLWRYDDAVQRENVADALADAPDWQAYKESIRPELVQQSQQSLTQLRPGCDAADGNQLYEFRIYDVMPGLVSKYMSFMSEAIENREKRSPNFGFWCPSQGDPDRVIHLWAYRDFNHRLEVRRGALNDASWQTYLTRAQPILRRMRSVLMVPTDFSPLK